MIPKLYIQNNSISFEPEYQRVNTVAEVLQDIFINHCVHSFLLVRGGDSYISCGAKCIIDTVLQKCVVEHSVFSDFTVNPKIEDVLRGVNIMEKCKPDIILAVGGGSVLDMAKLVRHSSSCHDVPLVAIPTTAGTGAESTSFSVCYENGVKKSIAHEDMLPNYVILSPELTVKNNPYLSACAGFDALAQAIEAYWNINATDASDKIADAAIKRIYTRLPDLHGNVDWRAELIVGANMAGRAINITRTTAPHALSYTLTSRYGYPHGHAVALTFPYFFAKNVQCPPSAYKGNDYKSYVVKMDNLLKLMGLRKSDDLYKKMKSYTSQLGLGYDVNRPFDAMVIEQGINLERAKNNPYCLDKQIIHEAVASIKEYE